MNFVTTMPKEAKESPGWLEMERNLRNMGLDDDYKEHTNTVTSLEKLRPNTSTSKASSKRPATEPLSPPKPPTSPQPTITPTPGHVFILNTSVCQLYVDAFLAPCDFQSHTYRLPAGTIHTAWRHELIDRDPELFNELIPTKTRGDLVDDKQFRLVSYYKSWPFERFKVKQLDAVPLIVLGHVGYRVGRLTGVEHVNMLMETVEEFVGLSLKTLRSKDVRPMANKKKYVLGLPVLGTGYGMATDLTGEVLASILKLASRLVESNDDLDICLCCADEGTFCMAQSLRRKMIKEDDGVWRGFRVLGEVEGDRLRDAKGEKRNTMFGNRTIYSNAKLRSSSVGGKEGTEHIHRSRRQHRRRWSLVVRLT